VPAIYDEYSQAVDEWQLNRMVSAVEQMDDCTAGQAAKQEALDNAWAKYVKRLKRRRDG
jgi:hypothetical protein